MGDLSTPRLKLIAENVRRWPLSHFDDGVTKLELIEEILDLRSRIPALERWQIRDNAPISGSISPLPCSTDHILPPS